MTSGEMYHPQVVGNLLKKSNQNSHYDFLQVFLWFYWATSRTIFATSSVHRFYEHFPEIYNILSCIFFISKILLSYCCWHLAFDCKSLCCPENWFFTIYLLLPVVRDLLMALSLELKINTMQTRFFKMCALVWPL